MNSIRDYYKFINVQDLTTGDIVDCIPINRDKEVTTTLELYELELITTILDLLQHERNVCLKTGYKGD